MRVRLNLLAGVAIFLAASLAAAAQQPPVPKGEVIEQIIARVNDDIITSHQYQQALTALHQQIKQKCPSCSQAELEAKYQDQKKNVLRDLIDQSLLVQRAEDQGINVDLQVINQLDRIREHYNLPSMNALRQAVEASGMNWENYKAAIRRQLLTQKIVQRDVGSTVQIDHTQVQQYYNAHKDQFNRPESVVLREIFLSTKGKAPVEIAAEKKKIENLRQRVLNGDDFGQLAKLYSQGSTAKQGGELGTFEKGQLATPIQDAVFKLYHNQMTPVIRTTDGFELLQVEKHYQAGIQPVDAVETEIENDIYMKRIGPALRAFLEKLRRRSYIKVQPGYVDTAAVAETPIEEVSPGFDQKKNGKKKKGRG